MNDVKPHICFVAPTAFSLVSGNKDIKIVGGAELQQSILSKALVKRGFRVTMICMDHGQDDSAEFDGVEVLKAYAPNAGIPVFRFIHPRLTSIWRAMKRANADIYIQSTAGMLTGVIAAFCRYYGKKSIYYGASDPDFIKNTPLIKYQRDRWIFEFGLRNVDQVLVQNPRQKELCCQNYGRESIQVPNVYDCPDNASNNEAGYILWVSTIRQLKRPELYLALAQLLPNYQFVMVGGIGHGQSPLYESIKAKAETLDNFKFIGFVPFSQVEHYYDDARLVINTSDFEGFPNAFLQAWARKIPTVSFFDCGARDDEDKPVGFIVDSLDSMRNVVEKLMIDNKEWSKQGERCQAYFATNHSIGHGADIYISLFSNILSQ